MDVERIVVNYGANAAQFNAVTNGLVQTLTTNMRGLAGVAQNMGSSVASSFTGATRAAAAGMNANVQQAETAARNAAARIADRFGRVGTEVRRSVREAVSTQANAVRVRVVWDQSRFVEPPRAQNSSDLTRAFSFGPNGMLHSFLQSLQRSLAATGQVMGPESHSNVGRNWAMARERYSNTLDTQARFMNAATDAMMSGNSGSSWREAMNRHFSDATRIVERSGSGVGAAVAGGVVASRAAQHHDIPGRRTVPYIPAPQPQVPRAPVPPVTISNNFGGDPNAMWTAVQRELDTGVRVFSGGIRGRLGQAERANKAALERVNEIFQQAAQSAQDKGLNRPATVAVMLKAQREAMKVLEDRFERTRASVAGEVQRQSANLTGRPGLGGGGGSTPVDAASASVTGARSRAAGGGSAPGGPGSTVVTGGGGSGGGRSSTTATGGANGRQAFGITAFDRPVAVVIMGPKPLQVSITGASSLRNINSNNRGDTTYGDRTFNREGSEGGGRRGGLFGQGLVARGIEAYLIVAAYRQIVHWSGLAVRSTLELAQSYERAKVAFEVMTGSAQIGLRLLTDLSNLAIETPFHSQELIQQAKQLKAFGFSAGEIIPVMRAMGEASSATNTPLDRIVLAFGQVRVAGRLLGTELRQFNDAGIPMIENLSAVLGKPPEMIRQMVHDGQVGYPEVVRAFNRMTQAGGIFHGMMERISFETVSGRWEAFTENIQVGLRNLGLAFFAGFGVKDILNDLSELTRSWQDSSKSLEGGFARLRRIVDGMVAGVRYVRQEVVRWAENNKDLLSSIRAGFEKGGNVVVATILSIVGGISALLKWVNDWANRNKDLVEDLVALATVLGGITFAVAGLSLGVRMLSSAMIVFRGVFTIFSAIKTVVVGLYSSFTLLVSPIGLVVLGIAGIVLALRELGAFEGFGQSFVKGFGELGKDLKAAWQGVKDAINDGNVELAAEIVFSTMRLAWQTTLATMAAEWNTFASNLSANVVPNVGGGLQVLGESVTTRPYEYLRSHLSNVVTGDRTVAQVEQEFDKFIKERNATIFAKDKTAEQVRQAKLEAENAAILARVLPYREDLNSKVRLAKFPYDKDVKADFPYRFAGGSYAAQNTGYGYRILAVQSPLPREAMGRGVGGLEDLSKKNVAALGGFGVGQVFDRPIKAALAAGWAQENYLKVLDKARAGTATEAEIATLPTLAKAAHDAAKAADAFRLSVDDAAKALKGSQIPVPYNIDPRTRRFAEDVQKEVLAGTGAYDQFRNKLRMGYESRFGDAQKMFDNNYTNPLGAVLGGAATFAENAKKLPATSPEYRFGLVKTYQELRKSLGDRTEQLPTAALKGTREAQEIINRQGKTRSVEEQIAADIALGVAMQREQKEYERRAADALEKIAMDQDKNKGDQGGAWVQRVYGLGIQ